MNLSDVQDVFAQWVTAESGGIIPIWEQQNKPRPELPYIGLLIIDLVPLGQPDLSPPDNNGARIITGNISLVLSMSYYSKNAAEMFGVDVLEKLRLSLWKQSIIELFRENNIGVQNEVMAITNLSEVISTGFEQRYTQDLNFLLKSSITDDIGLIEKTNITGKFLDATGEVNKEIEIDVDAS